MKNIYEILEDFGLEIPAEKKTDFEKAWKENYRTKSEYDNAVTKRDEYKLSLIHIFHISCTNIANNKL